jgi:hypothetical protein
MGLRETLGEGPGHETAGPLAGSRKGALRAPKLREAPGQEGEALGDFLAALAPSAEGTGREALRSLVAALKEGEEVGEAALPAAARALLARLSPPGRDLVREAAEDLEALLAEAPEASLARDWSYLCRQIRADLAMAPEAALERLDALRRRLLRAGGARLFSISGDALLAELRPAVDALLAGLARRATGGRQPRVGGAGGHGGAQAKPSTGRAPHRGERREARPSRDGLLAPGPVDPSARLAAPEGLVLARLRERAPETGQVVFVGLVNPNTQGGVFVHSAPSATYRDTGEEDVLRFLATKLYAGGGAHSMFIRTWGAGLAYSNGFGSSPRSGRSRYYAERCPALPQTLRFVISELKAARPDPALAEYAVAQVFESRGAASYETRGEAMAEDFADGVTPELVGRFRDAVLALRARPDLASALSSRLERVYGELLPGYGPPSASVAGAVYFVIGPQRQLEAYEEYLREVEGPEARLHRLWPRDFWMTRE